MRRVGGRASGIWRLSPSVGAINSVRMRRALEGLGSKELKGLEGMSRRSWRRTRRAARYVSGNQFMYIVYQSTSIMDTLIHVCQDELSRE